MSKITELVAYFCQNFPKSRITNLNNTRMTKMVYLADWKAAIDDPAHRQITDVTWEYYHYGPYSDDVFTDIKEHQGMFTTEIYNNNFGRSGLLVQLTVPDYMPDLTEAERKAADFVLDHTGYLSWGEFIAFIYDTYPIRTLPRYSHLDLPALAKDFREMRAQA